MAVFFGFWRGCAFAAATAQFQDNLTPEVPLEGGAVSRSISDETPRLRLNHRS
ncbi:MAG: hypothetical protein WCD53_24130 [Microcoleus sp.]